MEKLKFIHKRKIEYLIMESKQKFRPDPNLKLEDQVRQVIKYYHYALRTEKIYYDWIDRYIKFHGGKTHPKDMGKDEIECFLSHLSSDMKLSASTQKQALNALIFLYKRVLDIPVDYDIEPVRAKRHKKPPVVFTQREIKMIMAGLRGVHLLMAKLLYGSGLRLMECIRLRIKNIDFERRIVHVYGAKGNKHRSTVLPEAIYNPLKAQIDQVRKIHDKDLLEGWGEVYMPEAIGRKYKNAARELGWQYLFPAKKLSYDPRTGKMRRHHVIESGLQKAVKRAILRAGITKQSGCHTFRHSFATHLLENGTNIRAVQKLMGHKDVKTTEIYTYVMEKNIKTIISPLDELNL